MKYLSQFAIFPYLPIVLGILLGAALGYFGQCSSGTCPLTSTWWRGAIYGGVLGTLFFFSRNDQAGARTTESRPKENDPPAGVQR